MEWIFMGSDRFWRKFDSDFTGWNYMDWIRSIDILKPRMGSRMEWVFMGSDR